VAVAVEEVSEIEADVVDREVLGGVEDVVEGEVVINRPMDMFV
jgi:hypothetical protein